MKFLFGICLAICVGFAGILNLQYFSVNSVQAIFIHSFNHPAAIGSVSIKICLIEKNQFGWFQELFLLIWKIQKIQEKCSCN